MYEYIFKTYYIQFGTCWNEIKSKHLPLSPTTQYWILWSNILVWTKTHDLPHETLFSNCTILEFLGEGYLLIWTQVHGLFFESNTNHHIYVH